jgi:hypothetical protein
MESLELKYIKAIIKKILFILVASTLIFFIYYFYVPSTHIGELELINPIYNVVKDIPLWLYLTVYFIIISLVNVFIFLVLSLYYSYIQAKRRRLRMHYETFFATKLCEYFLTEKYIVQELRGIVLDSKTELSEENKQENKIKEKVTEYLLTEKFDDEHTRKQLFNSLVPYTKTQLQIESLLSVYTKYQEMIAEDLSGKFKELMHALKIDRHLKTLLYAQDLDGRILALKVLSYIGNTDYKDKIIAYSKHKNYALRTQAIAALIRIMDSDKMLLSLIGEKHKLSLQDINVVVNSIINNFNKDIDLDYLIKSANDRKKIEGLMLAKYRLVRKKELIIHHVGNDDNLIRKIEWHLRLSLLSIDTVVSHIINNFSKENDSVKLTILEESMHLNNPDFHTFLQQVIEKEPLLLKIQAMKILFKHNINLLANYMDYDDKDIKMAYDEVTDIYIN